MSEAVRLVIVDVWIALALIGTVLGAVGYFAARRDLSIAVDINASDVTLQYFGSTKRNEITRFVVMLCFLLIGLGALLDEPPIPFAIPVLFVVASTRLVYSALRDVVERRKVLP